MNGVVGMASSLSIITRNNQVELFFNPGTVQIKLVDIQTYDLGFVSPVQASEGVEMVDKN
jgi:hypothetical protein